MKEFLFFLFLFTLLVSCSPGAPSDAAIQTAIVATEGARPTGTPVLTDTPMPTVTKEPTSTPVPTNTPEKEGDASAPLDTPEQVSDIDAGQIYATAIRQMYSVDHSFDDPQDFPLVYIVTTTDDGTTLDVPASPPQKLSPELRQAIEAGLDDLLIEIIWVESLDEVPVGGSNGIIAEGQGIVITPGNILPQDDGTVQLPFYMLCGSLCLSGKVYVLGKIDGAWRVTGNMRVEVMG